MASAQDTTFHIIYGCFFQGNVVVGDMTATQGCGTIRLPSMDYSTFSMDYAAYFLPPWKWLPTDSFFVTSKDAYKILLFFT